jgi:hypothetical protein
MRLDALIILALISPWIVLLAMLAFKQAPVMDALKAADNVRV